MRKQSNWDKTRAQSLPRDWEDRRKQVKLRAKGRCENVIEGKRCMAQGTECHHAGEPDDHRISALQWLCEDCHEEITRYQSWLGQINRQARLMHPMQRKRYLKEKLGTTELPKKRR